LKSPASTTTSGLCQSVDEDGCAQELRVGKPLVCGVAGRVQVRDEQGRAVAEPRPDGLDDPPLLSPGEPRHERQREPARLCLAEVPAVQHEAVTAENLRVGTQQDGDSLAGHGRPEQPVVNCRELAAELRRDRQRADPWRLRNVAVRLHSTPALEVDVGPSRQLLQAEHIGPI